MDNSPIHDEAASIRTSRTLDASDVGLNSLLALDARDAGADRRPRSATRGDGRAAGGRVRAPEGAASARRLWDDERGVFANRLRSGGFVRAVAPTSFYPAALRRGEPRRAGRGHGRRCSTIPRSSAAPWLLPSVTRDDPAFADNVYWRGRVWPPLNFLVYHGLRRAGLDAEAASRRGRESPPVRAELGRAPVPGELQRGDRRGARPARHRRLLRLGRLVALPRRRRASRRDTLDGFSLRAGGGDVRLGPVAAPAGSVSLEVAGGVTTLRLVRARSCVPRWRVASPGSSSARTAPRWSCRPSRPRLASSCPRPARPRSSRSTPGSVE